MNYPQTYIALAFQINCLIDAGTNLTLADTKSKIKNLELLDYLNVTYQSFDISLHSEENKKEISMFFKDLYESMDEARKLGVTNNGLCMIMGYCLEAIQHKPNVQVY